VSALCYHSVRCCWLWVSLSRHLVSVSISACFGCTPSLAVVLPKLVSVVLLCPVPRLSSLTSCRRRLIPYSAGACNKEMKSKPQAQNIPRQLRQFKADVTLIWFWQRRGWRDQADDKIHQYIRRLRCLAQQPRKSTHVRTGRSARSSASASHSKLGLGSGEMVGGGASLRDSHFMTTPAQPGRSAFCRVPLSSSQSRRNLVMISDMDERSWLTISCKYSLSVHSARRMISDLFPAS